MEPTRRDEPHVPPPSLWPIGFAVGIACVLVGLIVSWPAAAAGAVITVVFAFLWIRDVTAGYRTAAPVIEPERREPSRPAAPLPAQVGEPALPRLEEPATERFPRSRFLEFSTLGLGAAIGGVVTLPPLLMSILSPFTAEESQDVDVGAVDAYEEDRWFVTTFLENPDAGEVSRRTVFIRNNGEVDGTPSFTVLSNRCAHLGCPVQPSGPLNEEETKTERTSAGQVRRTPTLPAGGFSCPCHGGAYDTEGNRTAGPPVRALDRYSFKIRNGRLILSEAFSVSEVDGQGARAKLKRYSRLDPGVHADGLSAWLYPIPKP